jgi:hypothetical protein
MVENNTASTETVPMRWREKVRPAKTLLGTNQLTPLSETCDQQIIASPLITLHSPRTGRRSKLDASMYGR